jgi:hypothetical protein
MWRFHTSRISACIVHATLSHGGHALTCADLLTAWRRDASFRAFWAGALREVPFDAWCLELPPLTADSRNRKFECVCVESPALARTTPDPAPFAQYFEADPGCEVAVFENLGKDALMLAPCPRASAGAYTHLATFVRSAPPAQVDALWRRAAEVLDQRIEQAPVWFSTAGLGVFWLHLRLDARPKYYRYRPYADRRFGT